LAKGEQPPPSRITPPVTIDLPLAAFIPESYVSDLNLRLSLYQRMAAAGDGAKGRDALDAPADLERELNDRFGAPPAPVRNLLYIVRLRALAGLADIASIAREEREGREILVLRSKEGIDLRTRMPLGARRELERADGVSIGHNQLRLDLDAIGDTWREVLVEALDAVAGADVAVA
jgi:transcription-repair coupling factor (superfamily II helicase)